MKVAAKLLIVLVAFGPVILLGTDFPICNAPGDQDGPVIAWGDENFLVVWTDMKNGVEPDSNNLYGQLVSSTGVLIDTNFPISLAPYGQGVTGIDWDGIKYLIVWYDKRDTTYYWGRVYGQFVSDSGTLIGSDFLISGLDGKTGLAAVAWGDTNYLVAWDDCRNGLDDIYGQLVSKNGTLIDTNFPISTAGKTQYQVEIAWGDTNYLVVWDDSREGPSNIGIYGQLVSGNGVLVDTDFAIALKIERFLYRPKVAWDGSNYLVVWCEESQFPNSENIYGRFVSNNGELIGSVVIISNAISTQHVPEIAWGEGKYLIVWGDHRNSNFDIYGDTLSDFYGIEDKYEVQLNQITVFPNPFSNYLKVFGSSEQQVEIYDICGKIVKKIEGDFWDGRDANGRKVAAGIYFLKTKNFEPIKVVKLR